MYLLDKDTIIFSLKGHPAVQNNLRLHLRDPLRMCITTLMELYYGAHKSQKVTSNLAKIKSLEDSVEVISVGRESAEVFGICKAQLERAGNPLDDFDLVIASCALTHNLTLVTNNVKHFKRIDGLKLTNWSVYPEKESSGS